MSELTPILARYGLTEAGKIGAGNQTSVYALDEHHVLRPHGRRVKRRLLEQQRDFYATLDTSSCRFTTPQILAIESVDGFLCTIEPRLHGRDLMQLLPLTDPSRRKSVWQNYMQATVEIRHLMAGKRPFGERLTSNPVQANNWAAYLEKKVDTTLAVTQDDIGKEVPQLQTAVEKWKSLLPLVADVEPALVHGDYFPGNVMVDEAGEITAVIDFSPMTVIGDWQLDVLTAAIFLELTPNTTKTDHKICLEIARDLLAVEMEQLALFYRIYYALYFSFTRHSDPPLFRWCVANLNAFAAWSL